MSIKLVSVKCPECGANLPIEEGRKQIFCSYCGASVIVTDENEHVYRHIDEAGIKNAETERLVRMRELDLAERSTNNRKLLTIIWLAVSAIMLIISVLMMTSDDGEVGIIGILMIELTVGVVWGGGTLIFKTLPEKENEKYMLQDGGIRFPKDIFPVEEQNFASVENILKNAGFRNISCVNLHDLTLGLVKRPGRVEKITVAGKQVNSGGKVYLPNVPITITYHGK